MYDDPQNEFDVSDPLADSGEGDPDEEDVEEDGGVFEAEEEF